MGKLRNKDKLRGIKDKSTGYNPREYSRIEMLLIEMWMTLDGSGFGGQTSRKPTQTTSILSSQC